MYTLALGLSQFRGLHQVYWNLTLAAALLVTAPVIVIFFMAQKVSQIDAPLPSSSHAPSIW